MNSTVFSPSLDRHLYNVSNDLKWVERSDVGNEQQDLCRPAPYRFVSAPSFLFDGNTDRSDSPKKIENQLKHRDSSKSTVNTATTCSSSCSFDNEDEVIENSKSCCRRLNSSYCRKCGQGQFSDDTSVEMTLSNPSGSVVTVCSCPKSSKDLERSVLQNESLPDLTSSGAQLSAIGDYEASLLRYQMTLESLEQECESATKIGRQKYYQLANLCYTCGQLSRKVSDYKSAIKYFEQELVYTKMFTSSSTRNINSPSNDLCLAKCYNGLAKVYQYDMGESDSALAYYQEAFQLEQSALQKLLNVRCGKCNTTDVSSSGTSTTRHYGTCNSTKVYPCRHVATFVSNLHHQIEETKMNIGRIHFQNGHFDEALDFTIQTKTVKY